jgi:hypothetical protein
MLLLIYSNTSPVAHMLTTAGEGVVHGGFSAVGITGQRDSHEIFLLVFQNSYLPLTARQK